MKPKVRLLQTCRDDYASDLVAIDELAIQALEIPEWLGGQAPGFAPGTSELSDRLRYLLVRNSINYQFWEKTSVGYQRYSLPSGEIGTTAMHAGFQSLWPVLQSSGFQSAELTPECLRPFFADIPDLVGRAARLREVCDQENQETAVTLLLAAWNENHFSVALAEKLAALFPLSFEDPYLKKSQLTLHEIGAMARHAGGEPTGDLTVCADYQLPRILEGLGVLRYAPSLKTAIARQELIHAGGRAERALRAATVLACETIASSHRASTSHVDYWLWSNRNHPSFKGNLFHLTNTTRY